MQLNLFKTAEPQPKISYKLNFWASFFSHCTFYAKLLLHILLNSVPCRADGLLGDAHDAAGFAVIQAHLIEDGEEGVMGGLGSVFLLISSYSILLLTRHGDSFIRGLSLFMLRM